MKGSQLDGQEQQTIRIRRSEDEQQQETEELIGDGENRDLDKEVEIEKDFDPETAERLALLAKYRELEDQLSEAQDRVLRAAADADNFKKRLQREKDEQSRYANEAFMRDLLPAIDNLERALEHSQAGSGKGGLVEGLTMTHKAFMDTLDKFGCTTVNSLGKRFDPNLHEAVSQEESLEHEAGTVARELQKGYLLKERLLRPAMVVVSKPPSTKGGDNYERHTAGSDHADEDEGN